MVDELTNNAPEVVEQVATPEESVAVSAQKESDKENNMRNLRERAEVAERRAQELQRYLEMQYSQQQPKQPQQVQESVSNFDLDIDEDGYVDGKKFKKVVQTLFKQQQDDRKKYEEALQRNSVSQAEIQLKSQFSDFDSVVSKENLERLAVQKPALYRSIMASQDIYDRGYAAYEMIKSSNISGNDGYAHIDKKLEENRSKPRSAASASPQAGETPLTRVGDYDRRVLTEAKKEQIRRDVAAAKQRM
jgi:hypothetical protein